MYEGLNEVNRQPSNKVIFYRQLWKSESDINRQNFLRYFKLFQFIFTDFWLLKNLSTWTTKGHVVKNTLSKFFNPWTKFSLINRQPWKALKFRPQPLKLTPH